MASVREKREKFPRWPAKVSLVNREKEVGNPIISLLLGGLRHLERFVQLSVFVECLFVCDFGTDLPPYYTGAERALTKDGSSQRSLGRYRVGIDVSNGAVNAQEERFAGRETILS
jgi:hypothetical protein